MSIKSKINNIEQLILDHDFISTDELLQFNSSHSSLDSKTSRRLFARDNEHNTDFYEKMNCFSRIFNEVRDVKVPETLKDLIENIHLIAGKTIGELAAELGMDVIKDLTYNTGWIGNLIEISLGATAGSKPIQDFANLGIELKTVSISSTGKVSNNIFISSLPYESFMLQSWETSHLLYKLQHVLFVPIEGNKKIDIADRRIGKPIFWKPLASEMSMIEQDWRSVMDLLASGELTNIPRRIGEALNVQVKALSSFHSKSTVDLDGFKIKVQPLSFYLNKNFLQKIFNRLTLD